MAIPPIAALEIGSTRTVICVGESDESGRVKITGVGTYPTIGVRKGQVIDLSQARVGIESAAKQAEKQADVSIWQVLLAISGGHIQAGVNPGMVTIRSGDHVVSREDIDEYVDTLAHVIREAHENPELVTTAPHRSTVHKNDESAFDDPAQWAISWRAYRRKFTD